MMKIESSRLLLGFNRRFHGGPRTNELVERIFQK